MYNRAIPEIFLLNKHALNLYKLLNGHAYTCEWVALDFNQILTSRQTTFMATTNNRKKRWSECPCKQSFIFNDRIPLNWFNISLDTFKVHCKREFMSV